MRIGIYGGTFNPIHNSHINIAKAALEQFNLDKVIFLIAGFPPQKSNDLGLLDKHRVAMVEIACSRYDLPFFVDKRELNRPDKSYTYITIEEYKNENPNDELFFIMGSDSLMYFDEWKYPNRICSNANLLVAKRIGDDDAILEDKRKSLSACFNCSIEYINTSITAVASSEIRDNIEKNYILLSKNRSKNKTLVDIINSNAYEKLAYDNVYSSIVKEQIDPLVYDYIIDHLLYAKDYSQDEIAKMFDFMKKELKTSRYNHSVGVAMTAYNLALRYDINPRIAYIAGIMHDCAKCISDEKRIDICKKHKIEIRDIELENPSLLHAKVGAFLAFDKYGLNNIYLLHSIMTHTVGCQEMSILDKIIFVADYIEPGRDKAPRLDEIRSLAFEDINKCVGVISCDTVKYLTENVKSVDDMTFKTCEYYKRYL